MSPVTWACPNKYVESISAARDILNTSSIIHSFVLNCSYVTSCVVKEKTSEPAPRLGLVKRS